MSDGSHLELPLRVLPTGDKAIALLMTNQCDFAVEDALAPLMAQAAQEFAPDVIAAVPTMGLDYARLVARGLGHPHYVALGHSRKFWYDEALSESTTSSTSTKGKQVYLDPALVERIKGKRVVLVDDVINTGVSAVSAIRLLQRAGANVVGMVNVLSEGHAWRAVVNELEAGWEQRVKTVGHIPMFEADGQSWKPMADTL
ncbi:hypothetical protein BMF29_07225 [Comamonas kerstersii]|nr:hypothetical protein BMF38_09570 [Comamonas kerstersii]OOH92939.1 hypothetical protein BMF29_07225 [Comamonas kerstersii]